MGFPPSVGLWLLANGGIDSVLVANGTKDIMLYFYGGRPSEFGGDNMH